LIKAFGCGRMYELIIKGKKRQIMNNLDLINRRSKVFDYMENNSVAIIFSGELFKSENGNDYDFEVNRDFYYLTGVDEEDCVLLLSKKDGINESRLFIPKNNEKSSKWTGIKLSVPEVMALSGIEKVFYLEEFEKYINDIENSRDLERIYCIIDKDNDDENYNLNLRMFKQMYSVFDNVQFYNIKKCLNELREIKSKSEIEYLILGAVNLKNAINMAMKITKDGVKEAEIAATIDYISKKRGDTIPFPTIVASGKNATTLHYIKAKDKVKNGELVLLDCGSGVNKYSADVSRTYPVSGVFTDFQKKVYNIVLKANKTVIENIKPGVTLSELNDIVIDIYDKELTSIGLINDREEISDYYYHFVSHFIGLNCHDPFEKDKPLTVGNVITVEPGLYIEDEGIGIRIEDNVLVTDNGCIVLTKDIIKEVEDIEALMR